MSASLKPCPGCKNDPTLAIYPAGVAIESSDAIEDDD